MTTQTYSSALAHTNDADFRAWGLELSNALTAAGFPKNGDTGQIDWATVNRPGTNTAAGYEIRYLNDSLHATKPCYLKIEYGTASTATNIQIWVTAATSTNGAGTVAGTTMLTKQALCVDAAPVAGNYPTFICCLDGYMAMSFKRRAQSYGFGTCFFSICRTVDSAGSPTTTGFSFYFTPSTNALYRTTFIASQVAELSKFCFIPGNIATTSLVGGDAQVFRHFVGQPISRCVPFLLSFIETEIGDESTFSVTPIGVTTRTYLALAGTGNPVAASANANNSHRLAMQYE